MADNMDGFLSKEQVSDWLKFKTGHIEADGFYYCHNNMCGLYNQPIKQLKEKD